MKEVVILNGYTLGEETSIPGSVNRDGVVFTPRFGDWDRVIWGHESRLGRLPMALWWARHVNADHLIISTGASKGADGQWEAEAILEVAQRRFKYLQSNFPHRFHRRTWRSEQAYLRWLEKVVRLDTQSKNTSECMGVVERMIRQDILHHRERVIVHNVSSGNHIPRVARDAGVAFKVGTSDAPLNQLITLVEVHAETSYGGKSVADTIVDDLGELYMLRPKPGVAERE